MLETLRTITTAECLPQVLDYSIIFVAFDSEEPGCFGSLEFIKQFVMPNVIRRDAELGGVFIVDTVANVDFKPGSQVGFKSFLLNLKELQY